VGIPLGPVWVALGRNNGPTQPIPLQRLS
jgi:hypothetical protein